MEFKCRQKLFRLAFFSDLHGIRCMLVLAELFWASALLWPGNTLEQPIYAIMVHALPSEEFWGLVWLFSALTQLFILISGKYHELPAVIFAGFNSILWWFVTISMYLAASLPPAAIGGEAALAFGAGWIWVRSGWLPIGMRRSPNAD